MPKLPSYIIRWVNITQNGDLWLKFVQFLDTTILHSIKIEFTLENSIKLDEIQSQIMKLSSLEKVKKYNYLLYNIRVLLSRLESLKKYYDKCNNKLGMLNREIAQLEFKLLKNDKEREF